MHKFKSRKFIAFVVWLILTAFLVFFKNKTEPLQYFFIITVVYIGGQSVIDTVKKLGGKSVGRN